MEKYMVIEVEVFTATWATMILAVVLYLVVM